MHVPVYYNNQMVISSNKEIKLSSEDITISRTNVEGKILFCNQTLLEISGYEQKELLNASHNILRHPDMPKTIFYLLWQKLLGGIDTEAVIKNFTRDGDYYWTHIKFSVLRDNHYNIISYIAHGKAPSKRLIEKIEPLYNTLLDHELRYGMYSAIKHLSSILEEENIASYADYIHKINENKKPSFYFSLSI